MKFAIMNATLALLSACFFLIITYARAQKFGDAVLMYQWNRLEFDWQSNAQKEDALLNETYIPERSLLAGVKLYKGQVYLTTPRWRWPNGIPVVLARVVKVNNKDILRPYPNWEAQKQGDCNALQYVQSMEIDPNTGLMYVIDTGRIAHSINLCPAKIVVYDLKNDNMVDKYEFPDSVVNSSSCFLNDLVLDYIDGVATYVYISNTFESTIVVYNIRARSSYKIAHPTMGAEGNNSEYITINGVTYNFPMPVNGIAMSYDFNYVYYSSLAGYNLHQVPTATLRNINAGTAGIRTVGRKTSQTDGLAHGEKYLYYGAIGLSSVYYWDKVKDLYDQKISEGQVKMITQVELKGDNRTMEWPDTFAFDGEGWLWVVTSRLQVYWMQSGLPETGDPYLRIWKIYVNESSYLDKADLRTKTSSAVTTAGTGNNGGNNARTIFPFMMETRASLFLIVFISLCTFITSLVI